MNPDQAIPSFAQEAAERLSRCDEGFEEGFLHFDQFQIRSTIDYGRHGLVLRALWKIRENTGVALKQIKLQNAYQNDQTSNHKSNRRMLPYDAVRELAIHCRLSDRARGVSSAHVVEAFGIVSGEEFLDEIYLAMSFCPFSLSALIDTHADAGRLMDISAIKFLFKQLLEGLEWLHGEQIMHRDLAPSNILFNSSGVLQIADFGEARAYQHQTANEEGKLSLEMTERRTTIWWRAPEVCLGSKSYSIAIDMWAAGCILGEMLLLEPVLQGDTDIEMLSLTAKLLGPPKEADLVSLQNANPIDFKAWESEQIPRYKHNPRSLEVKFERHGGRETVEMLATILQWNPYRRLTAKQTLDGSRNETNNPEIQSVASRWWAKQPTAAEHQPFIDNDIVQRLMKS